MPFIPSLSQLLRPLRRLFASILFKRARKPETMDGHFRFLDLPGELRNQIYKLVLTADGPLLCATTPVPNTTVHRRSSVSEFNQLQSVNWQLRYETRNLELKFNTLRFFPTPLLAGTTANIVDCLGLPYLLDCRTHLAPERFKFIKKVRIRHGHTSSWTDVTTFCRAHPRIELGYVLIVSWIMLIHNGHLEPNIPSLNAGCALMLALRNDLRPLQEIFPWVYPPVPPAFVQETGTRFIQGSARFFFQELEWCRANSEDFTYVNLGGLFSGISNLTVFPIGIEITEPMPGLDMETVPDEVVHTMTRMQEDWSKWMNIWYNDGIKPGEIHPIFRH